MSDVPAAVAIRIDVKGKVEEAQKAGTIRGRVVDQLVEEEISKRADLLAKVFAVREQTNRDLDKIRPDQVSYNDKGEKVSEFFSKAKFEERKKATERLGKIDKALDKALNEANYEELKKWASGGGDKGDKEEASSSE